MCSTTGTMKRHYYHLCRMEPRPSKDGTLIEEGSESAHLLSGCCGCSHALNRRRFLGTSAAATLGFLSPRALADVAAPGKVRIASLMPAGYLTTSFQVYLASRTMVIHQARTTGNLDLDRGCRTQLAGEVCGDIMKLFNHWDAWHRITVYGDLKEPLRELGAALGLTVTEEA